MDVKNTFLHGNLQEEVYISCPTRVRSYSKIHVCSLQCHLNEMQQTPHSQFDKFHQLVNKLDFGKSFNDLSMFLHCSIIGITILLVYIDDIIIIRKCNKQYMILSPMIFLCILVMFLFHGNAINKRRYLNLLQKKNIELCHLLVLKLSSFVDCYLNWFSLQQILHLYMLIR